MGQTPPRSAVLPCTSPHNPNQSVLALPQHVQEVATNPEFNACREAIDFLTAEIRAMEDTLVCGRSEWRRALRESKGDEGGIRGGARMLCRGG